MFKRDRVAIGDTAKEESREREVVAEGGGDVTDDEKDIPFAVTGWADARPPAVK